LSVQFVVSELIIEDLNAFFIEKGLGGLLQKLMDSFMKFFKSFGGPLTALFANNKNGEEGAEAEEKPAA